MALKSEMKEMIHIMATSSQTTPERRDPHPIPPRTQINQNLNRNSPVTHLLPIQLHGFLGNLLGPELGVGFATGPSREIRFNQLKLIK